MVEKKRKGLISMKKTLRNGLTLIMLVHLTGCADWQKGSVIPDYSSDFLMCVADEYESDMHGECTKRAIRDWSVIIDE